MPFIKEPTLRQRPAVLLAACLVLTVPGLAAAADAPKADSSSSATAAPPTAVSGVVVTTPAKEPPAVAGTYPAAGTAIAPGTLILKITFSQRMDPSGWRFERGPDKYPQCLARPRLLPDEKTFVLLCSVGGQGKFSIQLNAPGDGGFVNTAGQRATPFVLEFTTTDATSVGTLTDALKAAGLKPEDDPVMDKRPAPAALATNPSVPAP